MITIRTRLLATALAVTVAGPALAQPLFWSTQAQPIEETQAMREQVLSGFEGGVDYQASDPGPWLTRIQAETQAGSGTIVLLGALHGDFASLVDGLASASDVDAGAVLPALLELGELGTGEQKYVPWMQATYVMAAHRQALDYLPEGADLNALLRPVHRLDARARRGDRRAEVRLPRRAAGPEAPLLPGLSAALLHRLDGHRVPLRRAVQAWEKFRELWQYTNPASTNYGFLQEQLISGEVWVAFDHTARLAEAFNQRPDDFVAFPVPAGPAGRAFMPVIAGMAIPATSPDMDTAKALIEYMLRPETQIATLRATNFYPVVAVDLPDDMPASVLASGPAIAAMTGAPDALPALLPVGLGDLGGQFNQVYIDTFERIILGGQDIREALDGQAESLRRIMDESGAPCWAPDAPSEGACPVN
jgi:multiple sugar transport system substrate-binding protein